MGSGAALLAPSYARAATRPNSGRLEGPLAIPKAAGWPGEQAMAAINGKPDIAFKGLLSDPPWNGSSVSRSRSDRPNRR